MSIIMLAYLPALLGIGAIALLVFSRRSSARATYNSFVAALVFILIWQLTQMISLSMSGTGALYMVRFSLAVANFMTPSLLLFALLFPKGMTLSHQRRLWLVFVPALILFPLSFSPDMVSSVYYQETVQYLKTGTIYNLQTIYTVLYTFAMVVILLFKATRRTGNERSATVLIAIGLLVPLLVGAALNYLTLDGSSLILYLYPASFFVMAAIISYAMFKYRLFDIKLAAVRSLAYILSLLAMTGIYFLLAYAASIFVFKDHITTGVSLSPINITLALILAFIFQPLKKFFDKVTNDIFYHDAYSRDAFFARLSGLLTSTTNLRSLLETASNEVATTLKAEQVFFYLHYVNEKKHHMTAGTSQHASLPAYDAHMLDEYLGTVNHQILVTDFLSDKDESIRRMLRSHRVALVMPLRQGKDIIGYLFLGEHRSGTYTKYDLETILTTSNELVIAIQNALSLHEVKELNATLQQRIDVATKELRSSNAQLKHLDEVKDEFMSMASHQLRTPLTSIKGYLSMVIDGDVGKVTPQQEKLLREAFNSSERMVHLIADFLNVSRLQTGKFVVEKAEIDLNELVRAEVEELKVMATGRNMTLHFDGPAEPLYAHADAGKLREVIMNFVDNAIYYSKAESTIAIKVAGDNDSITFTVVDTGIGVPKDEQTRLFSKFFRATNARKQRPDGTGVGLYLARKVVAAHHGSIIFASHEGKGSTFGFRLPRSKAKAKS